MRVVSDNEKCIGCLACVVSCMDHHYDIDAADPVALRNYTRHTWPSGFTAYITESCHHCADAPCMDICPVSAIYKDEKGIVLVDADACVGCLACKAACPFDIPKLNASGAMTKCDLCGGDPQCVKVCPAGALGVEY